MSWEIDNSGCLSGFGVWNGVISVICQKPFPSPTEGLNYTLRPQPITYRFLSSPSPTEGLNLPYDHTQSGQ